MTLSINRTDSSWISPVLSFTTGAVSVCILWYWSAQKSVLLDWKSRIGELSSIKRRTRWPWDRQRSSHGSNDSTGSDNDSLEDYSSDHDGFTNESKDGARRKETCIGSIFGLDVGGTLAKLVYFEKKPPTELKMHLLPLDRRRTTSTGRIESNASSAEESKNNSDDLPSWMDVAPASSNHIPLNRQDSMPERVHEQAEHPLRQQNTEKSDNGELPIRKTTSMTNMSERAQAMEKFYDFARRLDSYRSGAKDHKLSFYSTQLGGEFHFIQFETRRMAQAMQLIRENKLDQHIRRMGATGGGAHKYHGTWKQALGITMEKQEELESLVAGMQFVLATVIGECYTFRPPECKQGEAKAGPPPSETSRDNSDESIPEEANEKNNSDDTANQAIDSWWWSRKVQRDAITYSSTYPYMLVTIGTGVSLLRVDGPRQHERISGSTIGGGTYWGLIRLLTQVEDFEQVMRLAERGDATKVDMMVGDIYGTNSDALEKLGLPSNLVASSFGKLVAKEDPAQDLTEEDLARALLLMVTNNIGQVAYLNAKLHKTPRIYFVGNFLRQNNISQRRLSYAIDYWSKGEMEALFLEHEGYFGALGAFLLAQNIS